MFKGQIVTVFAAIMFIMSVFVSPVIAARPAPTEVYGNNLSTPAIFAEGIGLTGVYTSEDTGLRGGPDPYLVEPYVYDGVTYYLQQTVNTWQAQSPNGAEGGEAVRVDWADNLVRQTWNTNSTIRVEVVLFKDEVSLNGYEMAYFGGEGVDEVWGTTGSTYTSNVATVYSICSRLKIEKLYAKGGVVMGTGPLYDSAIYEAFGVDGPTSAYSAEINVSGKLIYGYNWNLARFDMTSIGLTNEDKSGWYRLTFSLDPSANYTITGEDGSVRIFSVARNALLDSLDPADIPGAVPEVVIYPPQLNSSTETTLEIYIAPKVKGKK